MTSVPEVWPDEPHRPDYAAIAELEHLEDAARRRGTPPGTFLPHDDPRVRRACTKCVPGDDAKVIQLRPPAPEPVPREEPGTPEIQEPAGVPAVADEAVEVVDGEIVDEPVYAWRATIERRPVVAKWVRDAQERRLAAEWFVRHVGYVSAFHALRVPLYAARTVSYSPRGGGRAVASAWRWVSDAEGRPLRMNAVASKQTAEYMALSRQRNDRVKLRGIITVVSGAGTVIGWVVAAQFVPHPVLVTVVLLVLATGVYGRRLDKPLIDDPIISNPAAMKLTSGVVVRALGALGIAEINKALGKNGEGIGFAAPISRDGPGWRADVDLPPGVTPGDVMEKRDRLASGLRRPLGAVWPEPAPEIHAARMVLWVGDQDMNKARQPAWPLLKRGKASVFEPLPFGTDQRGRNVDLPVMYTNLLIGALPGAGKTFSLRVPLLGAALDPACELRVFELKGSGDLSSLEKVAHHYASGLDDETLAACLESLREIAVEVRRRAKAIASLPKDLASENKVTPEIAAKRSLRLWPLVFAIDECQNLFMHKEFGKEAAELCTFIIKIGRAFGVLLWLATQRPDKDSLPTAISANVGTRFCLRVMGQVENDMILGTSMYQNGIRASTFTINDLGIGYLVGAGPDPRIVHSYDIKNDVADRVTDRARALRAAAGTLSGHALGEEIGVDVPPAADLLDDVAVVFGADERLWSEVIIERLRELRPGTYDALNQTALANLLRTYGIRTADTWGTDTDGTQRNRKGVTHWQIAEAREARRAGG